jgi:hypothetical protein
MRLDVITDHTEKVLNLMMDKAIRECDPEYGRVADTWYTMAEVHFFSGRSWRSVAPKFQKKRKIKWHRLRHIINVNRVPLLKKRMNSSLIF